MALVSFRLLLKDLDVSLRNAEGLCALDLVAKETVRNKQDTLEIR